MRERVEEENKRDMRGSVIEKFVRDLRSERNLRRRKSGDFEDV